MSKEQGLYTPKTLSNMGNLWKGLFSDISFCRVIKSTAVYKCVLSSTMSWVWQHNWYRRVRVSINFLFQELSQIVKLWLF